MNGRTSPPCRQWRIYVDSGRRAPLFARNDIEGGAAAGGVQSVARAARAPTCHSLLAAPLRVNK